MNTRGARTGVSAGNVLGVHPLAAVKALMDVSSTSRFVCFADIDGTLVHYPDAKSLAEVRCMLRSPCSRVKGH